MSKSEKEPQTTPGIPELVAGKVKEAAQGEGFQAQIYKAIAVQRPVVLEYLRSVRRDKPDASPGDILKELDSRYVATVTIASSGIGASAAIPGFGVPIALGLGVADLLFFYETSALYVLAVAELHGISVEDPERAKPLVFGMLLGQKSQSQVSNLVLSAFGAGGAAQARTKAAGAVGKVVPVGWGEVLTQQLPESALAPLTIVLGREALKVGRQARRGNHRQGDPVRRRRRDRRSRQLHLRARCRQGGARRVPGDAHGVPRMAPRLREAAGRAGRALPRRSGARGRRQQREGLR